MSKLQASNEFVIESREHLQSLEDSLLQIENSDDLAVIQKLVHEAFRVVHSLKGNAGFFGLTDIRELAHAAESVLEIYRSASDRPDPAGVQSLLSAGDRLRAMVDSVDTPSQFDNDSLIAQLNAFLKPSSSTDVGSDKRYQITIQGNVSIVGLIDRISSQDALMDIRPSRMLDWSIPIHSQSDVSVTIGFDSSLDPMEVMDGLRDFGRIESKDSPWIDISRTASVLPYFGDTDSVDVVRELRYGQVNLREGLPESPVFLSTLPKSDRAPQSTKTNTVASHLTTATPKVQPQSAISETLKTNQPRQTTPKIGPTTEAVVQPAMQPVIKPAMQPVIQPAMQPVIQPAIEPVIAPTIQPAIQTPSTQAPTAVSDKPTSIRIPVDLLDRLMNLVGELTIVRNQSQATLGEGEDAARAVSQRLDSVTSELQDAVLKTRMQPVGNLFGRFPRMVRDLARQLGKQVEISFLGQEVELDKSVLEQLSDPLTHLIRNSIDHGIEMPDARAAQGKPAVGRITVAARAGDGQVHIEIKDDGRGIDPAIIKAKVIALGLKSESELAKLNPKELASFILLPGFSTAAKVTDVSGRGVGMDVVKTNIERLEGSLTIDSELGTGTTILLRVPLTLAIIPCLIVHVGKEKLAIPQRAIEEIVCIYPGGHSEIESTHNAEYLRLRESLVPVARMDEIMANPKPFNEADRTAIVAKYVQQRKRHESSIQYVLVLNASGRRYGLLVDDVKGTEEVVVKPMHPSLKKVGTFSGATVMGDGCVALIASAEGIIAHADAGLPIAEKIQAPSVRNPDEVHRVLLFEFGPDERFALPLIQIKRIEAISVDSVENVGGQKFVNIGGVSTRLIFLNEVLNVSGCQLDKEFHVIMPKFVVEPMGIVASRIVDTESMSIELQEASVSDPGILGTALIRDRLSLFLDTQYLREKTFTTHLGETTQKKKSIEKFEADAQHQTDDRFGPSAHVLLIDDTPFFREIVRRYLESQGMTIVTAVDGVDGLQKCFSEDFDLIVSDIEMPNMNGWEFCAAARQQGYHGPMIALSSLSKLEHEEFAKESGFDTYEEKLDHDRLIQTVRRTLDDARRRKPSPTHKSFSGGAS
jgi:two-component system, chemotaxis family, sensor kinase CheA